MSDFVEIINPRTMTATMITNGEITEIYKVEQCDSCKKLVRFDSNGNVEVSSDIYQLTILWLCRNCRPSN